MSQQRQYHNISRDQFNRIVDRVAAIIMRKPHQDEIAALPSFIQNHAFHNREGLHLVEEIAKLYAKKLLLVGDTGGTQYSTRYDDLTQYQQDEIAHMTPGESAYKTAAYPVNPERGAPLSGSTPVDRLATLGRPDLERLAAMKTVEMSDTITGLFDASSTDNIVTRLQSYNLTYDHVTLSTKVIQLDTRNSQRPYDLVNNLTEFKWYVNGVSQGVIGQVGNARVLEKLTQVIDLRANEMFIPIRALVNKEVPPKLRLFVRNMSAQSVVVSNYYGQNQSTGDEKMYHIEFAVTSDGSVLTLRPLSDFKLQRPFTVLEELHVSFLDDYETVQFEPDRGVYSVSSANPAVFTSTTGPHGLSTGDTVVVFNYSSANANLNKRMNASAGLKIVKTSNITFTVAVDTSAVAAQNGVSVYYESKRITMQLFFKGLEH